VIDRPSAVAQPCELATKPPNQRGPHQETAWNSSGMSPNRRASFSRTLHSRPFAVLLTRCAVETVPMRGAIATGDGASAPSRSRSHEEYAAFATGRRPLFAPVVRPPSLSADHLGCPSAPGAILHQRPPIHHSIRRSTRSTQTHIYVEARGGTVGATVVKIPSGRGVGVGGFGSFYDCSKCHWWPLVWESAVRAPCRRCPQTYR
jgi:hypothetical protein